MGGVVLAAAPLCAAAWGGAAEIQAKGTALDRQVIRWFGEAWNGWTSEDGSTTPMERGWGRSVLNMRRAGADADMLEEAVATTMRKKMADEGRWRYFCKVVWNQLRERTDIARSLLEADSTPPQAESDAGEVEYDKGDDEEGEGLTEVPVSQAAYGAAMAALMSASLWVHPEGHMVHKAWGPCTKWWWFDPQGFIESRTIAFAASYDEVHDKLEDRDAWAFIFCEDCCIAERERSWPECFDESYAAYCERRAAADPWSTAHIPRRVDADEVYV